MVIWEGDTMDRAHVHLSIMFGLFNNDETKIDLEIANLINTLASLNQIHVRVHYKGNDYTNTMYEDTDLLRIHDVDLPDTLIPQLDKLIESKQEMKLSRAIVSSYIRRALNISEYTGDLYSLLDRKLHTFIRDDGTVNTLSDDVIHQFKVKNKVLINTVKIKLLENLILNRG